MIAKTEMGRGFRGALNYALEKKDARLIGGNMATTTPRGMAKEFKAFRELRPRLKKAVAHVSLSVEKTANLDDEQWSEIAEKYMQDMGFGDAPYALVRHFDAEHDHVHIIASRIRADGSVVSDSWNYPRQEKVMREVEIQYNLQRLESSHESPKKAMSHAEVRRYNETGEVSDKVTLQNMLDAIIANQPSNFADFADACEAVGIRIVPQLQKQDTRLNGLVYSLGDIHFKASSLGKKYAPAGLSKSGVVYGTERDYEAGRRLADSAKDAAAVERSGSLSGSEPSQSAVGIGATRSDQSNQRGIQDTTGVSRVDRGTERDNTSLVLLASGGRGHDFDVRADALAVAASGVKHKSKALIAKENQWQQQHEALQALRYRITLKGRREGLRDWNLGKNKEAAETLWTPEQVTEKLGFLSKKNAEGYDIYLTPMDTGKHFFLVDDMTPESEKALINNGYTPALIQESSAGNRQAVLICARDQNDQGEQQHANKVLAGINKKYGDPKLSGVIRPFRLAGFANKKEGKGSPFTKIVSAVNRFCDKTFSLLRMIKENAEREREAAAQAKLDAVKQSEIRANTQQHETLDFSNHGLDEVGQVFDDFRCSIIASAEKRGLPIDESVVDFQAVQKMLKMGYSALDAEIALMQHPATARKHDSADYAARTVSKAESAVGRDVERSEYVNNKRNFEI